MPEDVLRATEFLCLAYPELTARPVTINIQPTAGTIVIAVFDAPGRGAVRATIAAPLLGAAFEFSSTGRLESFQAQGLLLDETRNSALATTLRAHPQWTDTDAEAALQALGGRAADGQTPFLGVDPQRLLGYLGRNPRVLGTARAWRDGAATGAATFKTAPGWTTEIQSDNGDGTAARYELAFEPFGGRLRSVTRR